MNQTVHAASPSHAKHKHVAAFTLIELSIVLVIIGLIVGGVLVGQDLIRAAEMRSVLTDIERFNTAANTFQGKYNCLPGDCPNATSFFGTWASCSYGYSIPLGQGTCNGNGDGKVVIQTTATGNYFTYDETTLFWQHLTLAGLIQGSYGGATDGNGFLFTPAEIATQGPNAPLSHLDGGCFSVGFSDSSNSVTDYPSEAMNAHIFMLGNVQGYDGTSGANRYCAGGLYSLPSAQALSLDSKIDDGLPFSGSVQTPVFLIGGVTNYSGNSPPGCTTYNQGSTPQLYSVSAPASACQLAFKAAF